MVIKAEPCNERIRYTCATHSRHNNLRNRLLRCTLNYLHSHFCAILFEKKKKKYMRDVLNLSESMWSLHYITGIKWHVFVHFCVPLNRKSVNLSNMKIYPELQLFISVVAVLCVMSHIENRIRESIEIVLLLLSLFCVVHIYTYFNTQYFNHASAHRLRWCLIKRYQSVHSLWSIRMCVYNCVYSSSFFQSYVARFHISLDFI